MRSFVTKDVVFRERQQNITQMDNTVTLSTYVRDVNFTKIPVDTPEGKKPFGRRRYM